jgi:hypothetical protein
MAIPQLVYDGVGIVFEVEIFDLNDDYDTNNGVFTCPVTGMYLFAYVYMIIPEYIYIYIY